MCTQWLVRQPNNEQDDTEVRMSLTSTFEKNTLHDISNNGVFSAYTTAEVRTEQIRRCVLCNALSAEPIVANPFTQRNIILLCTKCTMRGVKK